MRLTGRYQNVECLLLLAGYGLSVVTCILSIAFTTILAQPWLPYLKLRGKTGNEQR
jgi:hypothetical protein